MWNNMFERLRRRMTLMYAFIFGMLILLVVGITYCLVWYAVLMHEKEDLVAQIYHEAEEYVATAEAPVSDVSIKNGSMLAFLVKPDNKTVLLDQLTGADVGDILKNHRQDWPESDDSAAMLRIRNNVGERYRYLAAVAPVKDGDKVIGRLYMFKNMEFYYDAAYETLLVLLCIALLLFIPTCLLGYWLSKRNIRPIQLMYDKQKQFTADASHEMRTPLAVLNLAVQGLLEDTESRYSAFAAETLQMLKTEVSRLRKLTDTLMELARRDNLGLTVQKDRIDFTALCRRVINQFILVAEEKQQVINTALPEKLFVKGDADSLNMLLIILLDNAVKYSPVASQIFVKAEDKKDSVILQVQDQGIGISDVDKEKIFDRFFRVDKVRSREQGGLGLGLALAQSIVRLHGGAITVLDNKPHGTIMQVRLPK